MSKRGWVLFSALSLLWGVPYLFIKIAVEELSPAVVVLTRTALAAALLLPLAAARGQLRAVLTHWRWVLLFAAVEIAVPFWMLGAAELRLSSSLTGLLVAAVPLIGAALARLLHLSDRLDRGRLVGLLVGITGVAALVGIDVRGGDLLAVGAVGLAAVGYAVGPIVASQRLAGLPGIGLSGVAMAVTALAYVPFGWATRPADLGSVSASAWAAVAVLGAVCSAVAFLVFFALVAEVGPSRAVVITYVNPAVAVLLGVLLLDEPLTVGILVGFPLVLLGSYLATRRSRDQTGGSTDVRSGAPTAADGAAGPALGARSPVDGAVAPVGGDAAVEPVDAVTSAADTAVDTAVDPAADPAADPAVDPEVDPEAPSTDEGTGDAAPSTPASSSSTRSPTSRAASSGTSS
jgi:drug/metabolite transporter (DMT)-like permease